MKRLCQGPAATPDVTLDMNRAERAKVRGYTAIRMENLCARYLLEWTGRLDSDEFGANCCRPRELSIGGRLCSRKLTEEENYRLENRVQA